MACEIVRSDQDCDEGCCWQYFCVHGKLCDVAGNHLSDEDDD